MKSTRRRVPAKESCSCTSCVYRSDSDHPLFRKMITRGSKVDRLYYGRYLPMRERNLLGKLVRTRAEYDDIRKLLLSGSSSSNISNKADFKPRNRVQTKKEASLKNTSLSGLVDMVDKGDTLEPYNISDCCSCCSCSSKMNLQDENSKSRAYVHLHPLPPTKYAESTMKEAKGTRQARNVRFKTKHIRSDPCTCTFKFSGLMNKHRSKNKFMKSHQNQPEPVLERFQATAERRTNRIGKGERIIETSLQKTEGTKTRLMKNMEANIRSSLNKLHDSRTKLKENLTLSAKKSKEALMVSAKRSKDALKSTAAKYSDKIKQVKHEFKDQTIPKRKTDIPVKRLDLNLEEKINEKENFYILKDSITKYREEIERKREMKDWECQFDCYADKCVPEECYDKLKIHRKHKQGSGKRGFSHTHDKKIRMEKLPSEIEKIRKHKAGSRKKETLRFPKNLNMKEKKLSKSSGGIKNDDNNTFIKEELLRISRSLTNLENKIDKEIAQQRYFSRTSSGSINKTSRETGIKTGIQRPIVTRANKIKILPKKVRLETKEPSRQLVKIGSSFDFNIEFYKTKAKDNEISGNDANVNILKNKRYSPKNDRSLENKSSVNLRNHHETRSKVKHISTEVKPTLKNSVAGSYVLKRCFCSLKLKPKNKRSKINKKVKVSTIHIKNKQSSTQGIQTKVMNSPSSSNSKQQCILHLNPYECEPLTCVPGECEPAECAKLIKKRNVKYRSILTNTNQPIFKSSRTVKDPVYSTISGDKPNPRIQKHETKFVPIQAPNENIIPASSKQVRIGSSFDFNIELYKEDPKEAVTKERKITPVTIKPKKGINSGNNTIASYKDKSKKQVVAKQSQISRTTEKSKNTIAELTLPRCFCKLKLDKRKKHKHKSKLNVLRIGTITSLHDNARKEKAACKNISVMTDKLNKLPVDPKIVLLPYECEPGVCAPVKCNPYECIELVKRKYINYSKTYSKKLNTSQRRNKSSSSSTSKSNAVSKPKHVQSTAIPKKLTFSRSELHRRKLLMKEIEHYRSSILSFNPNRKAVKIGSRFNLSIEFYKENPSSPDIEEIESDHISRLSHFLNEDQHLYAVKKIKEKNRKDSRTLPMKKKSKALSTNPTVGFQSHEIEYKNAKISTTKDKLPRAIEMISAGTKTNEKYLGRLEPYECEPFICVPGECDNYQCLDRMKRRRQVKQIGVATTRSKLKSTASLTVNSLPRSKYKNARMQSKDTSRYKAPVVYDSTALLNPSAKPSRQVVRIGSSFNFDIEISKTSCFAKKISVLPNALISVIKAKLIKSQNRHVSQDETQTDNVKIVHKASEVAKILRRCFCTLQLQNKNKVLNKLKQPINVYTVSMVTVDNTDIRNINKTVFPDHTLVNNLKSNLFTNQNELNCDQGTPSTLSSFKLSKYQDKNDLLLNYVSKSTCSSDCLTDITGASRYLKRCFCAMNIHVANQGKYKSKRKLKPQECEPGVCVPYECDPSECEKLIMKRLIKQASKISGTTTSSRSSYTSNVAGIKTRKIQSTPIDKNKKNPKGSKPTTSVDSYQKIPKTHRQAVRVGSCFKFDVEFSKERLQQSDFRRSEYYQARPSVTRSRDYKRGRKNKTKGTRGYKVNHLDRDTQSYLGNMEDKASSVTTRLKRCFCTLKLQEKRMEKKVTEEKVHQSPFTSYKKIQKPPKCTQNRSTITPKFQKLKRNVASYECEPGVCIPGECNHYKCLELIKIRNSQYREFGTDSMKQQRLSTGTTMKIDRHKAKGKRVQYNIKEKTRQHKVVKKSPLKVKNRKSLKTIKFISPQKRARQAVRIGSSFSFNVEFYKERVQPSTKKPVEYFQKPQGEIKFTIKPKSFSKSCQNEKDSSNTYCQVNSSQTGKSTMTKSYLERCFCTAKLHGNTNKTKCRKPRVIYSIKSIAESVSASAQTDKIKTKSQKAVRKLDPYECEPGICVPGECDPYDCEKVIKRRNEIGTLAKMTPGISTSSITSSLKSKDVGSQYRSRPKRTPYSAERTSTKSIVIKPQIQPVRKSERTPRQAVRIGSSFSFDVEFYKDKPNANNKPPKSHQHEIQKSIKVSDSTYQLLNHYKNRKTQEYKATRDDDSQVKSSKMRSAMTQMTPMLKRCFCTLKLRKDKSKKLPKTSASTATQKTMKLKEYHNQVVMSDKGTKTVKNGNYKKPIVTLKPYECEPGICIPGECDPYECDKRIQIRNKNMRSQLIETKSPEMKSTYVSDITKLKGRKIQAESHTKTKKAPKIKELKNTNTKTLLTADGKSNRKAVRIGSSFHFDVEFFKDRSRQYCPQQNYKEHNKKGATMTKDMSQSTKSTYQGVRFHHRPSQNTGPITMSKDSGVGSMLKRCFCTLKLQKNDRHQEGKKYREMKYGNNRNYKEIIKEDREIKRNTSISTRRDNMGTMKPKVNLVYNATTVVNRKFSTFQPYKGESVANTQNHVQSNESIKYVKQRWIHNLGTETKLTKMRKFGSSSSKKHVHIALQEKKPLKYKNDKGSKNKNKGKIGINKSNRPAIRFDSGLSFSIELLNDNAAISYTSMTKEGKSQSKLIKTENTKLKHLGTTSKSYCDLNQSIQKGLKQENKRTGMKGFLKRCYSTLTLQKTNKFPASIEHMSNLKQSRKSARSKFLNHRPICVSVTNHKILFNSDMKRVSKPNICTRGDCNPQECSVRTKKREKKEKVRAKCSCHKDLRVSALNQTERLRKLQYSRALRNKDKETKAPGPVLVNQPCFSLLSDIKNRTTVCISSNCSCLTEFYKDTLPPKTSRKKSITSKTQPYLQSRIDKNFTVGRVEVDQDNKAVPLIPREILAYYQISVSNFSRNKKRAPIRKPSCTAIHEQKHQRPKKNNIEDLCKNKSCIERCVCTGECVSKRKKFPVIETIPKIEIISPYRPTKFKKNTSKTIVCCKNQNQNENSSCCSCCTCDKIENNNWFPLANKFIGWKKNDTHVIKNDSPQVEIKRQSIKESFLKHIIRKCKELIFSKPKSEPINEEQRLKSSQPDGMTRKNNFANRTDKLKYSKSERSPEVIINKKQELKMSKSLKVSYNNKKKLCPCDEEGDKQISKKIGTADTNLKIIKISDQKCMNKQAGDANYKFPENFFAGNKYKRVKLRKDELTKHIKTKKQSVFCEPIKQYGIKVSIKAKSSKLQRENQTVGKYFIDQNPPITPITSGNSFEEQSLLQGMGDAKAKKTRRAQLIWPKTNHPEKSPKGDTVKSPKQALDKNEKDIKASLKYKNKKNNKKHKADLKDPEVSATSKIKGKQITCQKTSESLTLPKNEGKIKVKKKSKKHHTAYLKDEATSPQNKSKLKKKSKDSLKETAKKSKKWPNEKCECVTSSFFSKTCVKNSCVSIISRSINMFKKPKPIPKDICSCAVIYKKTLANEKKLSQKRKVAEQFLKKKQEVAEQKRKKNMEKLAQKKNQIARKKILRAQKKKQVARKKEQVIQRKKQLKQKKRAQKFVELRKAETRRKIQRKLDDKAYQKRLKQYKKADKLRAQARFKSDNASMKGVKNRPDILLCAESICEVVKLGGRGVHTVGLNLFRFVTDPRYAKYKVKQGWGFFKTSPIESLMYVVKSPFRTVFSSLGRVKKRIGLMDVTKRANMRLRQYGVASAMLDSVQGKPVKKKKKKLARKKKEREPMDFQCNLYMASLRKRPYLAVYYLCPGFYPHFVSMFLALKQFLQMSLLLLAVVVWCPCILCVELCRAFLCCCVCTQ